MLDVCIQLFQDVHATESHADLSLEELATTIANPKGRIADDIATIRQMGKGHARYDPIKKGLPCVLPNVVTRGTAKDKDIQSYTGLLFIDIDGVQSEAIPLVKESLRSQFSSLLMCWTSVGGNGIGGILRVKGASASIFPFLGRYFAQYDIAGHCFDAKCFTKTRKAFISADPDLYLNWNATCLDLSHLVPHKDQKQKGAVGPTSYPQNKYRGNGPTAPFSGTIRFDNIADYFPDDVTPHLHFPAGIDIIQVERRWSKVTKDRNVWLFRNLVRVKHLNPGVSFAHLSAIAITMNRKAMANPMNEQEARKVATNVFRGNYQAEPNVSRKILFNPRMERSGNDRQQASRSIMGKARGNAIAQTIHDTIVTYDGSDKITAKLVSEISGLSIDAVKRKWPQFKSLAKDYNDNKKAESLATHGQSEPADETISEEPIQPIHDRELLHPTSPSQGRHSGPAFPWLRQQLRLRSYL